MHFINNNIWSKYDFNTRCLAIAGSISLFSYWLYYRKFRNYVFHQENDVKNGSKPRGKCLPSFPNGWYRLMNSDELKKGQVRFIDYCGRKIVIFRGTNNKVYALDAYCPHMGANLGIGGVVKFNKCIQCPFHGWLFDGETGNCVVSESLAKKYVEQYEYDDIDKCTKDKGSNQYLKKCYEGDIKLRKYSVIERVSDIYIWYDCRDEYHNKYNYEPFEINNNLEYRGESINYVNCHIQEIPENGADMRHFDYLHTSIIDFIPFLKFQWQMKSHRPTEPNFRELMKHDVKYVNDFKMKLFDRYINEENKESINVISLDCHLKVFNKWQFFLFNATGFQVGPALVYLFLKFKFQEVIYNHTITALDKFHIRVSHKIYANWYIPYGVSAYMLSVEVKQLFSDMFVWNNKKFGAKLNYNLKTEADRSLLAWRNWYTRFYEGCYEYEKKLNELDW